MEEPSSFSRQIAPDQIFRGAAPYYRYREGYPAAFFEELQKRCRLDGTQRVLDLGCGTAVIALGVAGYVKHVVGVDPEVGMLAEARRIADERNITNIEFTHGDSFTLPTMDLGSFDLVTMGQSFHWMDRPATLSTLARILPHPLGTIVISWHLRPIDSPLSDWEEAISDVRKRWLGEKLHTGAGSDVYHRPAESDEELLQRSAFSDVETFSLSSQCEIDIDKLVNVQFSFSTTTPEDLGAGQAEYAQEVRKALLGVNPSGRYLSISESVALIARRP
ncbi:MAG TPA: class I SAM-dependent methyltransferase [Candidatus Baltobacteraceae bacterium]|nr:class I SAM-dependent methyltransferase [Candidatus Baltobacteraceae bacterium]